MLERELQNYLFENPNVLFPDEQITKKQREVCIEGKRIDLLFAVGNIQYIIELKRDTIRRADVGQVFEYYARIRRLHPESNFRMVLAAPAIPSYLIAPLEEFGIRCIEVSPSSLQPVSTHHLLKTFAAKTKHTDQFAKLTNKGIERLDFAILCSPVSSMSMHMSQTLLRDAIPSVEKNFRDYEVLPVGMARSFHPDVLCLALDNKETHFVSVGAWWAYAFGHSETMPKNDVPNLSANSMPWGLDVGINAELVPSQRVFAHRVATAPDELDRLVLQHGLIEGQAWLKIEHQPRFYHWIPLWRRSPGQWTARELIELRDQCISAYCHLREEWITRITESRLTLTEAQRRHIMRSNAKLNLAFRLVRSIQEVDPFWTKTYSEQLLEVEQEYLNQKPLLDFFLNEKN